MQFTINFPPPQEQMLEEQYRDYIRVESEKIRGMFLNLGITIADLHHAHGPAYRECLPQTTEFQVVFQAVIQNKNRPIKFRNVFMNLLNVWMDNRCGYNPKMMPILCVSDPVAFSECRKSHHEGIMIRDIQFGTMPYSGQFCSYVSVKKDLFNSSSQLRFCYVASATFYHDARKLDLALRDDSSMILSINYRDVRKILISRSNNTELYLDLLNPPVLNVREFKRARDRSLYEVLHRVATLRNMEPHILGKSNVLRLVLGNNRITEEVISRLQYRCDKIAIGFANVQFCTSPVPSEPLINFPYFSCNYLFSAILNRNYSVAEQLREGHDDLVGFTHASMQEKHLEKALTDILFTIDSGHIIYFPQALSVLYEFYKNNSENNSFSHYTIPEKSCFVRRVTLTPTRTLMYPPEIMFENRVLRKYDPDYTLRVNFRDDNMSMLSWVAAYASEDILINAIGLPLIEGVKIGSRHYKFLGWSNSQIRDHGVWMYARDNNGWEARNIRRWMGNFSHIQSVSKYMARLGQCFTQTEDTLAVPLNESYIRTESDIEGGLNGSTGKPYCFSDGIGKISSSLAAKVQDTLGHDKHCSAFQIRYGGYKGMLVIDPTLKDTDIVFRDSMKKFDSPENIRLEVAKTSAPTALQLNRPFITILNQLGVKPSIFLQLQEDMLRTLTDMLLDEDKAAAYLKAHAPNIFKYDELAGSGIGLTTEPFLRSLLLSLHRHHVEKIKKKANINIDPSEGRNMFGVLDETSTLEYGQVFVQYTTDIYCGETTTKTNILKGTVLVTKNPCTHPGDVRKFTAVDVPALHHIVDCIVFPQKGPRPHPNEMAGSDLDGDEYAVLWKKELIFTRDNFDPANYPSEIPPVKANIEELDMIQFLIEYIANDQVGIIASAHLAHADKIGIFSKKCLDIAKLFSVAVDFAKHGTEVHLDVRLKPPTFPDFMERGSKKSYKSQGVLGKMFRICKDFETESKHASASYTNIQVQKSLVYSGWENYVEEAIKSRDRYNSLLFSILQKYGVLHETEAFSGAFTQLHCRYNERKDRDDIEKIIIGCLKALCKNMKKEFFSEFQTDLENVDERLLQKASAWYIVTYNDPKSVYLSFPWIVAEYLSNIRSRTFHPEKLLCSPVVEKMDLMILACVVSGKLLPLSLDTVLTLRQCHFSCDFSIIEQALQVLIHWAMTMRIILEPKQYKPGFMFFHTFLKLFIYVAQLNHYIEAPRRGASRSLPPKRQKTCMTCSASLCLAFFQLCVKLRFCNKSEVKKILPFDVHKHKQLAKHAMFTYHQIAICGSFKLLNLDAGTKEECVEMTPIYIDVGEYQSISDEILARAEDILMIESGVDHVGMRTVGSIKKVLVSAQGSAFAVKQLEQLLRKVNPFHMFLHLF